MNKKILIIIYFYNAWGNKKYYKNKTSTQDKITFF